MATLRSNDGTLIAYDQSGSGAPVILVDGALCSRNFGPMGHLSQLLSPNFTVFMYDRRGRGESGDTQPYAVEREIEDIEALIKAAGGTAFVYGTSSGGALALEAAARGLNIKKLVVYEPPFVNDGTRPELELDHAQIVREMVAGGRRGAAVEHFMVKMVGMPVEAVAPMRNMPMWAALEAVAHTVAYDATIMRNYIVPTPLLAKITVPTLAMDGGASPAPMRNGVEAVAKAIPNGQYRTLEGQTHDAAGEAVAPALKEFFS